MADILASLTLRDDRSLQQVAMMIGNSHNDRDTLLHLNSGAQFQIVDGDWTRIRIDADLDLIVTGDHGVRLAVRGYAPVMLCYIDTDQAARLRWRVDPFTRAHVEDLF